LYGVTLSYLYVAIIEIIMLRLEFDVNITATIGNSETELRRKKYVTRNTTIFKNSHCGVSKQAKQSTYVYDFE
jgi:hypothetical protein